MTIAENFDANWKLDIVTGCHVWLRACSGKEVARGGGYGCLHFNGKTIGAHVFVWEREKGRVPKGMQVMHSCHNTKCVNILHLSIGSNLENQAEKARALRAPHKLSVEAILDIKKRSLGGELQRSIAASYGIYQADVSNIVREIYWRHVA